MIANTNPETGIRYGVIACHHLDPDLVQDLFYLHGKDLSYEAALEQLRKEIEVEAEGIEDEVRCAIAETDPSLIGNDGWQETQTERAYEKLGYDDREDYIESRMDQERDRIQIDEPEIEGEYEGVKYRISWLGGAPLLWVLEGPVGACQYLCSPCVPNAGDLDSGFWLESESTSEAWDEAGHRCYVVPKSWLREEERDE